MILVIKRSRSQINQKHYQSHQNIVKNVKLNKELTSLQENNKILN